MLVFVPVFAGITIASGAIATGGGYSAFALGASGTFAALTESFLSPILGVVAALAVSGSVFPESSVEGFTALIKKLTVWGMTFFVTLFTGFVTLKSNLAAKTDGAAAKTARFMISGFVPIVGGAVSDAYSTVKGSFELIGSTVGVAGCLAIAAITLPPIVEVFAYRAVLWIGAATAEAFSAQPLAKLMKGIDDGLAIAQSVLVCYSVMLVICTASTIRSLG